MNADEPSPKGSFAFLNGREIFENGVRRRWRCPVCAWWREWEDERCCGCGAARDLEGSRRRAAAGTQAG